MSLGLLPSKTWTSCTSLDTCVPNCSKSPLPQKNSYFPYSLLHTPTRKQPFHFVLKKSSENLPPENLGEIALHWIFNKKCRALVACISSWGYGLTFSFCCCQGCFKLPRWKKVTRNYDKPTDGSRMEFLPSTSGVFLFLFCLHAHVTHQISEISHHLEKVSNIS